MYLKSRIMTISQNGIEFIKQFEGCKLIAYPDPATGAEPYTIGIGSTLKPDGSKVRLGEIITEQQAHEYLEAHLAKHVYPALSGLELNQNQFDALCSFVYNVGGGNFATSTLKKRIVSGEGDIKMAFEMWNKAAGKVLAGLTKRREAEAEMYSS